MQMTKHSWPSVEAFYSDDERRRRSGETDFGCWYKETPGTAYGPFWRVSYVDVTREVYAICLADDWCEFSGQVELLASGLSEDEAESLLTGWPDKNGKAESLQWARRQLNSRVPR